MLRSFHYAIYSTTFNKENKWKRSQAELFTAGEKCYHTITAVYLKQYIDAAMKNSLDIGYPREINYLLRYHLMEKAIYELGYELNSRPSWAVIPLTGIKQLLDSETRN